MWGSNPTPTLTGEWLMTMVHDILKQMPGLGQPQRKFLATLFVTILVLRGRVNFRNLSRYCNYSERTIARQFREPFDWPDFHQRVLMTALDPRSELISAHDASFLPKSGKQTFGLGYFFNGCASRAERGLEMSTLAVVDVTRRCAFTLAASHHLSLCRWLLCEEAIYGYRRQPQSACDHQTTERCRLRVSLHRTAPE